MTRAAAPPDAQVTALPATDPAPANPAPADPAPAGPVIRVLIVDDHAMVRRGLRDFLQLDPGVEVVAEAADGREALEIVATHAPDVVVMDLRLPVLDGIAATRRIAADFPGTSVVALTSFVDDEQVLAALEAGARGVLFKDTSPDELVAAIRAAHAGDVRLDPVVGRIVARHVRSGGSPAPGVEAPDPAMAALERLTARELDVLTAIARGLSNRAIGDALGITERTARTHVSNLLAKLGLASRTQAALLAVRAGIAAPGPPSIG